MNYSDEWLLPLEIAEELIKNKDNTGIPEEIICYLNLLAGKNEELQKLIEDGMLLFTHR